MIVAGAGVSPAVQDELSQNFYFNNRSIRAVSHRIGSAFIMEEDVHAFLIPAFLITGCLLLDTRLLGLDV